MRGIAVRDPELVFKAQLAASALERAWQRWRVMHGMIADPMPAISSYVGYSLEEPWGQPRVVFGLSAKDAEQLSALLNRHDCIGPVRATIVGQQSREVGQAGEPRQERGAGHQGERWQQREPGQQGQTRQQGERRQQREPGQQSAETGDKGQDTAPRGRWIMPPQWRIGEQASDTGPQSREPGPQSREPGRQSREPGPQSREPGPQSREPGPQSREPGPPRREPVLPGRDAGQPDRESRPVGRGMGEHDRGLPVGRPLPVPPQAPYFMAEQSSADDARSLWRAWRPEGSPDELDGPVYRQIARAALEAAEAKDAAAAGSADQVAETPAPQTPADQDTTEQAQAESATGQPVTGAGRQMLESATGQVDDEQSPASRPKRDQQSGCQKPGLKARRRRCKRPAPLR